MRRPGLAAGELGHVGVLLLRQHRAAGGVGVVERAEAELLGRPQHDLLPHARQVHAQQREIEERLGHEVAIGHRIEGVLEAAVEPELRGDVVGIERQRRPGQRAGAERRDVEAVDGGDEPVDVAGQRPAVRQQVVGQQHRLRPLHVRVAGQVDVGGLPGPLGQRVLERHDLLGHADERAAAPQAQRRGHLVVAAPPGVQLGPDVAHQLGDAPFDGGVDVLVTGGEDELARGELLLHDVEGLHQGGHLAVGEDARLAQALDVRPRAGQVVVGQHPVEGQADGERGHGVGHAGRDASLPERQCSPLTSPACSGATAPAPACAPGPWRADHVATPRPHRRTNPSASACRKVSDAS